MKKLPVGQQDFTNLVQDNCIYVDKTTYIHRMLSSGGRSFFLSRPRRFGKSLLLSTIKSVFGGKKELFKGLYIADKIDWEPHPVVMLDMSVNVKDLASLQEGIKGQLRFLAAKHGISLSADDPTAQFAELIDQIYLATGKQIVVLVDEYDKPILDAIHDLDRANAIRGVLYSFYTVLKASSSKLRFLLVTGITKISQTSIFSGFNNLNDISLDERYADICGYTQQELENDFDEHISALAEKRNQTKAGVLADIKHWYDGYSWDGKALVYNPYSVLLLLDKGMFKPFWYSTGTPTFLLKLLKTGDNLETVMKNRIGVFDTFTDGQAIERIGTIPLLFQAGYLTVKDVKEDEHTYGMGIPNEEVRVAIAELVLSDLNDEDDSKLHALSKRIREGFAAGDTASAIEGLEALLANTTYNTHAPNRNENHFQALFQLAMILSRINHRSESVHQQGRTEAG